MRFDKLTTFQISFGKWLDSSESRLGNKTWCKTVIELYVSALQHASTLGVCGYCGSVKILDSTIVTGVGWDNFKKVF